MQTGKVVIYKDSQIEVEPTVTNLRGRSTFQPSGVIVLGQDISSSGIVNPSAPSFTGEIGQVGVWSRILSHSEKLELTRNCSSNLTDTLLSWIRLGALKGEKVTVVEPATCGRNTCPPSFTGQFCETEIDKEPPTVVSCPNATKVVSPNRLSQVRWTEPSFRDNKAIATITQSHRSGSFMTWGDYIVTYIASDPSGNSASCTFELYVTRYDCPLLKPPRNGAKACGSWEMGRYCNAKCYPGHMFAVPHPPYYSCGNSGTWSHGPPTYPENPNNLLPTCSAINPPTTTTTNQVTYGATSCNAAFLEQFRREFIATISNVQRFFPICGASCDFSAISIKCDGAARKRRSTGGSSATITVVFPVNTTSGANYTEQVQNGIKTGQFNLTVTVNNVTMNSTAGNGFVTSVTTTCQSGSILNSETKMCVLCPSGAYHNVSGNECVECPVGFYQNSSGATNCTMCPSGTTTFSTSSNDSSACKAVCSAGSFFNLTSNMCEQCPAGFYQSQTGKMGCDYCLSGMTSNPGAKNASDCFEKCGLGSQLVVGDKCEPCPRGTYRELMNESSCVICPIVNGSRSTTYISGARSSKDCKTICPPGKEVSKDGWKCIDCPTGAYKDTRSMRYCTSCPSGTSTKVPGSATSSDCKSTADSVLEVFGIRFIDEIWNATLRDQNSTEFRSLASKVSKEIEKIYRSESGFLSVKVKEFQNGSVIAILDLLFKSSMPNRLNLLNAAVTSGRVGTLRVDATYISKGHCSLVTCTGKMEECRNNGSHGICVCKAGYYKATGSKQCEKDCEASFCLNSGKCQQGPNGRVCICASGYSGDRCQTESKSNTVVIVVCVIAAVVVVAIFAFILYKKKRTAYRLQKTSRLDNSSSPDHSPGYPMKSYLNPRFDIHGDEEQSNASASPSPTVHSFSNKVAAEPFEYNETDR